ncbi:hypothetical protein [Caldisalinibacter kiritimatiensis]|uniref:Uncharacterized protein n=1 Tax=Caldisalinibacter kiritimatiensis TaxID=1304284 RepID=R1CVX9_9FIRM|nr:hypothetical protein [Caldisalinibacter kiritimatiensis]EOD00799.1 hypothetical protein L21TH_1170 [Caldisalinibacter kiritimatiensis]
MKKVLFVLVLALTLFVNMAIGYCGDLIDPEPWGEEPVVESTYNN